MSPGRQIGMSPGWSNRIFRGRPGDFGGAHPSDVLGANICRLGSQFTDCATESCQFNKNIYLLLVD